MAERWISRGNLAITRTKHLAEAFRENTLGESEFGKGSERLPPHTQHVTQSLRSAHPASDHSPTTSVLRANPCPKVTDQSCRLPLPTFF